MSLQFSSSACPVNQVYRSCKPCHLNCDDLLREKVCTEVCTAGCACKDFYYWNGITCVPGNQCHTNGKCTTFVINLWSDLTSTHQAVPLNACCSCRLCDLVVKNISRWIMKINVQKLYAVIWKTVVNLSGLRCKIFRLNLETTMSRLVVQTVILERMSITERTGCISLRITYSVEWNSHRISAEKTLRNFEKLFLW